MSTTRISFPNGSTAGLGDIVGGGCIFTALACDIVPRLATTRCLDSRGASSLLLLVSAGQCVYSGKESWMGDHPWCASASAASDSSPLSAAVHWPAGRPGAGRRGAASTVKSELLPSQSSQLALNAECGREEEKRHPGTVFGRLPTTTPSRWGACTTWGFCARVRLPVQGQHGALPSPSFFSQTNSFFGTNRRARERERGGLIK